MCPPHRSARVGLLTVVLFVVLNGCSGQPLSTREQGTLAGGVLGSATGAIIGASVGSPAQAPPSAARWEGSAGLFGNALQNQEIANQQTQNMLQEQQAEIERQRRMIERLEQQMATE